MASKVLFYEQYGVEECYVYDPESNRLEVYLRGKAALVPMRPGVNFVSPRLSIRFDMTGREMVVRSPAGRPFQLTREALPDLLAGERRAARLAELAGKLLLQQATA